MQIGGFTQFKSGTDGDSSANEARPAVQNLTSRCRDKGFIYFIASTSGPIKIGFATNPKSRFNSIQTGNADDLYLVATVAGDVGLERHYHSLFAEHRIRGEWFRPHPSILAELDRLTDDDKW